MTIKEQINLLVDKFLCWPLPKSVCSDTCVTVANYEHQRIGTNLLTSDEARQMFEYLFVSSGHEPSGTLYIGNTASNRKQEDAQYVHHIENSTGLPSCKIQEVRNAVAELNMGLAWLNNGAGTYVPVKTSTLKRILMAAEALK
jgi:hypothetical protein